MVAFALSGILYQAALRRDSASPHRSWDLARRARVAASVERSEAGAAKIITGQVRDIPGKQINPGAGSMATDGAWIELARDQAQAIRGIQITFDTRFQRELTLTASDSAHQGSIRKGVVWYSPALQNPPGPVSAQDRGIPDLLPPAPESLPEWMGLSRMTVQQVWERYDLLPHRVESTF